MTEFAYSTDDPTTVGAFRDATDAMRDFLPRLRADIAALGSVKNPLVRQGVWGARDELVALEPDDSGQMPDGWRVVRGRLEPRRGKPGEVARQWLADHQPPDVRDTLTRHGLPRTVSVDAEDGSGRFRVFQPAIFEHDGTLWALFAAEPGKGIFDNGEGCTWTPRKLSEYHAAREAYDAAKNAERVPA